MQTWDALVEGGWGGNPFSRDILFWINIIYYICFFLDYSFALFRVQTYSGKIGYSWLVSVQKGLKPPTIGCVFVFVCFFRLPQHECTKTWADVIWNCCCGMKLLIRRSFSDWKEALRFFSSNLVEHTQFIGPTSPKQNNVYIIHIMLTPCSCSLQFWRVMEV